jgi:hypothetical protein
MNYDIEQGTDEWRSLRAGYVTASCISKVMSAGKGKAESITRKAYMTQLLVERLTGHPAPEEYEYKGRDVKRGKDLELTARTEYERGITGVVQSVGFVEHPRIELAGCSPDGLIGEEGLCQIKCPRRHVHLDYITAGIVPSDYRPQMFFEMDCTGRKWNDFVSYNEDFPEHMQLFIARLHWNEVEMGKISDAVIAFNAELKKKMAALPKQSESSLYITDQDTVNA